MVTENKSLWMALQTGGYDVDPSASGAGYTWLPAEDISFIKSNRKPIPTKYGTGRPWVTPSLPGPDGGEISFKVPLIGLLVSPAAGASPSVTLTYLEMLLLHILGGQRVLAGVGIDTPDVGEFQTAANAFSPQDLVPIFEPGVPADAERTQWEHITADDGGTPATLEIEPPWETTPTTAAIARGVRLFQFNNAGGGDHLALYAQCDDEFFTLLGCRVTQATIESEPQMRDMLSVTVRYNRRIAGVKASIPDPSNQPAAPEIIGVNAPVFYNDSPIETAKVVFDFGIQAETVKSRLGSQGRTGDRVIHLRPKVTVNPLGGEAYETLMHDQTEGACLIQFGAGVLNGTHLGTICILFPLAQVNEASRSDDAGHRRMDVVIELRDQVMFSAGVASRAMQVGVA